MKAIITGIALAAITTVVAAGSVAAQTVRIGVSINVPGGHVSGYHVRPGYVVRHTYCERSGPYRYCWDAPARGARGTVIYVYDTRGPIMRQGRGHGRRWTAQDERRYRDLVRRHRRQAERAYLRWHESRYPHRWSQWDVTIVLR